MTQDKSSSTATSNQQSITPPLVVIVGETASGKTALAIELAKRFNGEIICADSWTVRREVNIGTAKPSLEEQASVPHHLLDVIGPCGDFTAAVFKRQANDAIENIAVRGKVPIMAGGTGLYIDGVIFDYSFLPEGDRAARRQLNGMTAQELTEYAHSLDLSTANIDTRNKRRIIRLIETGGTTPKREKLRPNTLIVGVNSEREGLRNRIIKRIDYMILSGLEGEARTLAERYGWECEALKGIGYIEWREYFGGSVNFAQTRERIINATIRLAKRQRTWFKRNKIIQWVDDPIKAVEIVTTFLRKNQ
jgi:tRNA dimethylallyltransferase